MLKPAVLAAALGSTAAAAVTIAEINGNKFLSPLNGTDVTGIKGLVTGVKSNGIFLRSTEPDEDPRTSEGLFVFDYSVGEAVKVGDIITLDGHVEEYRSRDTYIYATELTGPGNIQVVSSGNEVRPLVIGVDTTAPPTKKFSSLDVGGIFGVPNAVNFVSEANPVLEPEEYGIDFWESLSGELVTVKDAYQLGRPNQYGDVWVRGDWEVTGLNGHGGLTMTDGDANPEVIIVGDPLDGTTNPDDTKLGDYLGDVTGIVYNTFGNYYILPQTKVSPVANASSEFGTASFESRGDCRGITVADYNAENLMPDSAHMPFVIDQIVHKLLTPDLIFLQEVQDNSGATNDGVTSANLTLTTLTTGIEDASGIRYDFVEIAPVDGQDGGQPGGNIRNAYLYRPDAVKLHKPNAGGSLDANEVLDGPELKYNPGLIDPTNEAFDNSRKPIAAMWKPVKGPGKVFFTVNVHFGSKGGSSTLQSDPRPPINNGVEKRTKQTSITANFIADIMKKDSNARVLTAGDFNEFDQVQPVQVFAAQSGLVDLEDVVDMDPVERYTYLYGMNSEALDHLFVSPAVGNRPAKYEHLHLNTWQSYDDQVSDHDPSVARVNLCGCGA